MNEWTIDVDAIEETYDEPTPPAAPPAQPVLRWRPGLWMQIVIADVIIYAAGYLLMLTLIFPGRPDWALAAMATTVAIGTVITLLIVLLGWRLHYIP